MTYQELIQVCKDEYGKDNGEWVARYQRLLNRANRTIVNAKEWPFMVDYSNTFNTTAADDSYTLTETNLKKILAMRVNTDGYEGVIAPAQYQDFVSVEPHVDVSDASEQGVPHVWYPDGRSATYQLQVRLYPVPDAVYEIGYDFYKNPTEMTNASDVPDTPEPYHDLLIDYVLWKSYQHERDLQTAQVYEAQFYRGLRRMMGDYNSREDAFDAVIRFDGQEVE